MIGDGIMLFEEDSLKAFLNELASDSPAPGGGSAAGLAGALGAALVSMVASLTTGSEKYRDSWEQMGGVTRESERLRGRLLELMNEDTEAFKSFIAALKMPKNTDSEKSARRDAMSAASKRITEVPLETLGICAEVASLAFKAAELGNPNAVSDAGSAALMAEAAGKAAALNVRINLPSLKDEAFASEARRKLQASLGALEANCRATERKMNEMLGNL